jgi:S-DNA-T family DNA segregation ATPase FtsK/SpoIIIE
MESLWQNWIYPLLLWGLFFYVIARVWNRVHHSSLNALYFRLSRIPGANIIRSYWRRFRVYDYWKKAFTNNGVYVMGGWGGKQKMGPRLDKVRSTPHIDYVTGRYCIGMTLKDIQNISEALATAFGAKECRVTAGKRTSQFILHLKVRDTLSKIIPAPSSPKTVDLENVEVGITEEGKPFRIRLRGSHWFVAGVMGSGKSSFIWAILNGIGSAIREGLVELWVIDPKGGMELSMGKPLYTYFSYRGFESMAELLEAAVERMNDRFETVAGEVRKHIPSVDEPHIIIIIDEIATLVAYMPDSDIKKRVVNALSILLTQGRAPGFTVIGAVQDPRSEIVPMRKLFPGKICFQVDEARQVTQVLGDGARAAGAYADKITEPGIGYVYIEGEGAPQKVRIFWVDDNHIRGIAENHSRKTIKPQIPSIDGHVMLDV